MKTRTGFVSNSSSSSYVLILKEQDFKDLLAETNGVVKSILAQLEVTDKKFGDEENMKVICWWEGNMSSFEYIEIDNKLIEEIADGDEDRWDTIHDCWEKFTDIAAKKGLMVSNHDS